MNELINELPHHDNWNRRLFFAILATFGSPNSFLDVGCGTGVMVDTATKLGIKAMGLDIIPNELEQVKRHDLTRPFDLGMTFDLVTCIEVMEHIPKKRAQVTLQSIAHAMHEKSILIFTAAGPGQNGIGHVNCVLGSVWRTKFHQLGVSYRLDYTKDLQAMISFIQSPSRDFLVGNMQIFDK